MIIDPKEFADTADHILNTIIAVYAEHDVTLPNRRYLAVGGQGETVHDCEQVTVSFEQGYSGLPGNQAQEPVRCDGPRTGVFLVEIVRCIPTANSLATSPDTPGPGRWAKVNEVALMEPDKQSEVARSQMIDAMLMLHAGLRAGEANMTGSLVDVSAGTPQGGFQAMIMTIASAALLDDVV